MTSRLLLAGLATLLGLASADAADQPNPNAKLFTGNLAFKDQVRPLLAKYCVSCHGPTKPKGDLNLEQYADADSVLKAPKVWELVADYVESGEMPPKDKDEAPADPRRVARRSPPGSPRQLSQVDCTKSNPGRVTLRRLNKVEYNNTIKRPPRRRPPPGRRLPVRRRRLRLRQHRRRPDLAADPDGEVPGLRRQDRRAGDRHRRTLARRRPSSIKWPRRSSSGVDLASRHRRSAYVNFASTGRGQCRDVQTPTKEGDYVVRDQGLRPAGGEGVCRRRWP